MSLSDPIHGPDPYYSHEWEASCASRLSRTGNRGDAHFAPRPPTIRVTSNEAFLAALLSKRRSSSGALAPALSLRLRRIRHGTRRCQHIWATAAPSISVASALDSLRSASCFAGEATNASPVTITPVTIRGILSPVAVFTGPSLRSDAVFLATAKRSASAGKKRGFSLPVNGSTVRPTRNPSGVHSP